MGDTGVSNADLNRTDEDILTYDVSDEALEAAAAGTGRVFTAMVTDCATIIAACCR